MNPNQITNPNTSRNPVIKPNVSENDLKALFYMFVGKPDSNFKLFYEPITVKVDDIIELNERVTRKLINHQIAGIVTTVNINYRENEIEEFGIWESFLQKDWRTPNRTETLAIKWDFLVNFPNFQAPQRHTLLVKIQNGLSPWELMQMMFSEEPSDTNSIDLGSANIFCRVDFINNVLSDELIHIVEQWQESRIKPDIVNNSIKSLKKHAELIARICHYSIPISISILACALMFNFVSVIFPVNELVSVYIMRDYFLWLFLSLIISLLSLQIGKSIAQKVYESIREYGKTTIFELTNGDKNRQIELVKNNKKTWKVLLLNSILALILNLVSAGIACVLFKN